MTLNIEQLEPRLTPASYIGDGLVQFAFGRIIRPYDDFHGPVNVLTLSESVWIAAGQGGGPRVSVHNPQTGERLRPDQWAPGYDPETYRGGIAFVIPDDLKPQYRPDTPTDLESLGFVLSRSNGAVPATIWEQLRHQIRNVPGRVFTDIATADRRLTLVYDTPITSVPALRYWQSKQSPDGRLYDTLPAVGTPFVADLAKVFLSDNRISSGSIIRHELAHLWLYVTGQQNTEDAAEFLSNLWG